MIRLPDIDLDDEGDYQPPDLGPCCVCEQTGPGVRNIFMLPKRGPLAGRGWGCLQCGLPSDGATAVVCDECLESARARNLKFACRGHPGTDGRVPIGELAGEFDHDMTKHPGEDA